MDLSVIMQGVTLAAIVGVFARLTSLESRLSHLEGYMQAQEHNHGNGP